jgi:hypothetical protein
MNGGYTSSNINIMGAVVPVVTALGAPSRTCCKFGDMHLYSVNVSPSRRRRCLLTADTHFSSREEVSATLSG